MTRLQAVEKALTEINDAVFQELCDAFLALRDKDYTAFVRNGSQVGKQKSIKGTPDSFKLLPNGKYIFIEHTTNISNKKKLEIDIKKCLDYKKTKIPISKIAKIILCANFRLLPNEVEKINVLVKGKKIGLRYYWIDELAIELLYNHRDLLKQYLGLPFDTGQIVSMAKFVDEYNKTAHSIATPLDNEFVHREKELSEFLVQLNSSDFIILTGAPGVGKTKLALEGISSFLKTNKDYTAYSLSYKNAPLLEDLCQYFDEKNNYLLFVDDANRIDAFNQVIGFFKVERKGKLKIIVTVRDYAYGEVADRCLDLKTSNIQLKKLNDEQITDILKSDSFRIYNSNYQREILRIADGNPRLAIMAAKLAIQEQDLAALSDVTQLFEQYFVRFLSDNINIYKKENLKTLGLISFFYTVPYKDKEKCEIILSKFGAEYGEFIDAIDTLNKIETVEIRFDYVKISEQNLATYFFYKAFIKDEFLSFNTLLENYYDQNIGRFKDTIIAANNTFGY